LCGVLRVWVGRCLCFRVRVRSGMGWRWGCWILRWCLGIRCGRVSGCLRGWWIGGVGVWWGGGGGGGVVGGWWGGGGGGVWGWGGWFGVGPGVVVGHSLGEVAAVCVAGGLSLRDAARMAVLRSQLLGEVLAGRGGMVSVALAVEQVERRLEPWAGRLSVGAVN